jgi:nicotinate-nucleotide pyrophosphorylase (carboxylating)
MDADQLNKFIAQALAEDIGDGDHTSLACIPEESRSTAELLVKDIGVIAGIEVAEAIFKHLDPEATMDVHFADGEDVTHSNVAFTITCNTNALLSAERLVLNTMQRMSGIATLSSRFAFEVEGMKVKVLDTRKTTPLFRFLEKEAVRIGGCENYRFGLYDWVMIKDNHIDACGGIHQAIDSIHAYFKKENVTLGVTIEVRNLVELYEVLRRGGVDRIMLDNFDLPIMEEAVRIIDGAYETEASGGITLNSVRMMADAGVDYISVGALTHSAGSLDMSLNIVKPV